MMKTRNGLWVSALAVAALALPSVASAGVYSSITIDGDFSDWDGIAPVALDGVDGTPVDFAALYLANDDDYLYLRITLQTAADGSSFTNNLYIDGDNNASTGYLVTGLPGFGSEILVQSSAAYQQAGGGFNEGFIASSGVIESPFATPATDFELRISRSIAGVSGAFNGQALISSDTIGIQFLDDNGDALPDLGTGEVIGASYTFAPVPEPASLALVGLGGWMMIGRSRRRA